FEAQVEFGTPDVEREAIRNCVEQAVFAEEVGFDGIWAVEHHSLIEYSHMSAPEIFLTAVAAKTSRIRVGHAAVCMPFGYNHPAPPSPVPRVLQSRYRAARRAVRRGTDGARLRWTRGDRRHAAHVRRAAGHPRPRRGRLAGDDQRRVRRPLPYVPHG